MITETIEDKLPVKRTKKNKKIQQMKNTLKQEFPNCFKSGNEKLPLKIGIHLQLHFHYKDDPRFEAQLIQKGLNSYASSPKYFVKIVEGASRFDIHGNPSGQVTAEEAVHAKSRLKITEDLLLQKVESLKIKETSKVAAEVAKKELILVKLLSQKNKIKSAPQTQVKTKEEIKKAKQECYAKKIALRKQASKKGRF